MPLLLITDAEPTQIATSGVTPTVSSSTTTTPQQPEETYQITNPNLAETYNKLDKVFYEYLTKIVISLTHDISSKDVF